jgi:hypothetical protein
MLNLIRQFHDARKLYKRINIEIVGLFFCAGYISSDFCCLLSALIYFAHFLIGPTVPPFPQIFSKIAPFPPQLLALPVYASDNQNIGTLLDFKNLKLKNFLITFTN